MFTIKPIDPPQKKEFRIWIISLNFKRRLHDHPTCTNAFCLPARLLPFQPLSYIITPDPGIIKITILVDVSMFIFILCFVCLLVVQWSRIMILKKYCILSVFYLAIISCLNVKKILANGPYMFSIFYWYTSPCSS